jgi:periodic tryptophan protein 2
MLSPVLTSLAELLSSSPHAEFLLRWLHALCVAHGAALQQTGLSAAGAAPALRGLQKALGRMHADLSAACDANLYTLRYLTAAPGPAAVDGGLQDQVMTDGGADEVR